MRFTLLAIVITLSLSSCATLQSNTYIDADQTFILGKGSHSRYKASVKNTGTEDVAIIGYTQSDFRMDLPVLKPGERTSIIVPKDTRITFKNLGDAQTSIKIRSSKAKLSMGYN